MRVFYPVCQVTELAAGLRYTTLKKGEQFQRIICFLLYYVATIKLDYTENYH